MTFGTLIQTTLWPEVKAALLSWFPDAEAQLEPSERVFRELRLIVPRSSDMRISIETTFREGLDDEPFEDVVGLDGTLNRELSDFEAWGEPDSALAAREVRFSLALRPWDEWLGMSIDPDAPDPRKI